MPVEQNSVYPYQPALVTRTYGTGKVLVLLHGWGLNSGVWHTVIQPLSKRYKVITIDLPGFGENRDNCPDDFSLDNIAALLATCIPPNAVLLGWSLGGLLAQQIAIQGNNTLAGLITVASTPCFVNKADWCGIKPAVLRLFEQQLENDYEQTLSRFLAIQALGSPLAKAEIRQLKTIIKHYPAPAITALTGGLKLLSTVDLRTQINLITVPTLRMYGRLDSLVPAAGIEHIQQLQPNANSTIFVDAAHAPFMSDPHAWLQQLNNFVASLSVK
jgi:pimeloyl-[acyl-carrier protein] methyl ester esterase